MLLTTCRLAHAVCIQSPDPEIRALQALAISNPNQALTRTQALLRRAAARNAPAQDVAWLHSVRAQAYSALELDTEARAAAAEGMKLVPDLREPVRLALFFTDSENIYDAEGMAAAERNVESIRATGLVGPEAERCLLLTLGTLQFRANRADLAVVNLTQAYRMSDAIGDLRQRMLVASALSKVMGELGDYRQALALNAEVIEWNASHGETLTLSVSRYLRGIILHEMHEYDAALLAFANARALSVSIGDEQGIAFADMRICDLMIDLHDYSGARARCEVALRTFNASSTRDVIKQTRSMLAEVDLAEGHAARALNTLNEILANGASDMPPREVTALYKLRSDANLAQGKLDAAFADLAEYMRRFRETNETRRIRQVSALRARFEIDRELDRNAALQLELAQSKERQAQLQRNSELLTLALIDLDHFKVINDRCGHAGGDQVLKEFAHLSRDVLRAGDIFGRWGGEEFLLVMPGAALDTAMSVVERLRARARTITVPGTGEPIAVSLSAGLATNESNMHSLDALVARADIALYRAKHDGRNLVRIDDASFDAASSGVRRALG